VSIHGTLEKSLKNRAKAARYFYTQRPLSTRPIPALSTQRRPQIEILESQISDDCPQKNPIISGSFAKNDL